MSTGPASLGAGTTGRRRPLLLAAVGLAVLLAVVAAWHGGRRAPEAARPPTRPGGPPPDPRLTFPTPYQNVRPEVRYVGSAACAKCHRDIAASYRHHPMGRSAAPAAELVTDLIGMLPTGLEPVPATPVLASRLVQVEHYDAPAHDPFTVENLEHRVELRGGAVIHREAVYDPLRQVVASVEAPVYLTVGFGNRSRSFVIARGDALFESPITWYIRAQRWDLSPDYAHRHRHFERALGTGCLYCHVNTVEPVPESANRYRLPLVGEHAIGCERCHGPGELHVRSRERGAAPDGLDTTIVNPARLERSLREAVCEQCHLQGRAAILRAGREWFDYRPGLPYHLFWSAFVSPEELTDHHKTTTTVEQMRASKCYQKSGGALGCISCHDPHERPAAEQKAAYYRGRCLECHAATSGGLHARRPDGGREARRSSAPACTESESVRRKQADSCIACHMAPLRSSDVPHFANTDHRVPRHVDETAPDPGPPRALGPGEMPLVHFHRSLVAPDDRGVARDLGIALALTTALPSAETAGPALPLLEAALRDWPDDREALEARAFALGRLGQADAGMAAYEALLARAPDRENALFRAAELAETAGRLPQAVHYYERAAALNPTRAQYHTGLGRVLTARGDWRRASEELAIGLRLHPFDAKARGLLLDCYLHLGEQARAREEYDRLLGFFPDRQEVLRGAFERRLRQPAD